MEETPSGIDQALLTKLRALARRGATLCREPGGAGSVQPVQGEVRARMTPEEMLHTLDRGWLKQSGAEQFILSKRGASMLRAALSRSAAIAAATVVAPATYRAPVAVANSMPQVDADESPLAWLRQRRDKDGIALISQPEFDAGERLRADFHTAQMTPRVTASWDSTVPGDRQRRGAPGATMDVSEAVVAARQRVEIALRAVGPNLSGVLIDVCCLLQGLEQAERNGGWPKRAGKVVLQIALDGLARHYGLIAPAAERQRRTPRHWGAPGYRPTVRGHTGNDDGSPKL